jgi:spore germination protein YaaH
VLLHREGRHLVVTVPPKLRDLGPPGWVKAWDYRAIGRAADRVRIMAYNLHADDTRAGPMAPLAWVDRVAYFASTMIDPNKVELGIPLFAYDWPEVQGVVRSLTYARTMALARHTKATRRWSLVHAMPWFTYVVAGERHTVWYADSSVVRLRLKIAQRYRLGGIALWPVGDEDPAVWKAIRSSLQ